jgi:RHS repeat-associated protein
VTGINQQAASYNANDQVLANTYDANGNTLGATGNSYVYDSMDRMTSFNNGSVKMVYDGDGNRVAKTAGGVTTQYLVDELNPTGLPQVMDEVVKSGAAQRTYLYGLRRISQTQVASGTTSYYGYDAHGDVRYLMNSGGAVTDTYDYDAFGNIVGSTGTTPNVYRYQGELLDSETGLYYMRARYYDPTVGRFLNVDPMTDQGEHPYEYAAADPVNRHDPTGTQEVLDSSFELAVVLPSVPQIMGAYEHIKCIASMTLSVLSIPGQWVSSVAACQAKPVGGGAGRSGRSGPGHGQPPNQPKPRTCTYLLVIGDCYYKSFGYVRRRDYEALDQDFQAMGNGVAISESVTNIRPSGNIRAGGRWTTGQDGEYSAFYDFYSNGTNSTPTTALQQYSSKDGPLQVLEPDSFTGNPKTYLRYGTQGVYYTAAGVKIDGYYINPIIGSKKPCDPPWQLF